MESKTTSAVSDRSPEKGVTDSASKSDTSKKHDVSKSSPHEEPKPRIVLTFRTEKPGVKSSSMKIVSPEEKHGEKMRNTSGGHSSEAHDDDIESPSKRSRGSQPVSSDEGVDSLTPKRSTRFRVKEYSDNVLANAIARKEKSYSETVPNVVQRPSRRIKPTAKVLANQELQSGIESISGKQGTPDKSPDEGVQVRRSLRRRSYDTHHSGESLQELTPKRRKGSNRLQVSNTDDSQDNEEEIEEEQKRLNKIKNKHLSKLGLKPNDGDLKEEQGGDDSTMDSTTTGMDSLKSQKNELEDNNETEENSEMEEEEVELEEDSDGDIFEDELPIEDDENDEVFSMGSSTRDGGESKRRKTLPSEPRRSKRRRPPRPCESEHSAAEEGDAADEDQRWPESVFGACLCEAPSKVYAAEGHDGNAEEPIFCRAIETVDGVRVGCLHEAARLLDGSLAPLLRAGPRTPYILLCNQHAAQLRKHMCCNTCGLFCTQGTFNRCSLGHMFHAECTLPANGPGSGGCPHCGCRGRYSYLDPPANRDLVTVRVTMHAGDHGVYLPQQRVHTTPAYQSFSSLDPALLDQGPVIPEDLLPSPPIDLKALCDVKRDEPITEDWEAICEAVANDATPEELASLMVGIDINKSLEVANGGTLAHLAAKYGNLTALYLLQYAGANFDIADASLKTPLMVAISVLLDKPNSKDGKVKSALSKDVNEVDSQGDQPDKDGKQLEKDNSSDETEAEDKPVDEEKMMKVIRYLVAAGCDVNFPGAEGTTALHVAAMRGATSVCAVILSSPRAAADARDLGGWSPLVWAAEHSHPDVVRLLLKHGADASTIDCEGNGALHWCALCGDQRSLRLLLHHCRAADIDALNSHGDTPLHIAARQGFYPCVVILLARGARTDIENSSGELALEVSSGECRAAIAVNMQMVAAAATAPTNYRLVSSDISCGREQYPIPCVNEVDDSTPEHFTYVTSHVMPCNIPLDNSIATLQGCTCTGDTCGGTGGAGGGGGSGGSCACSALGVRRWWRGGRLDPAFPYHEPPMLFQCNATCSCNMKQCNNSVLTRLCRTGATFSRVQVFRTRAAGWGLRAAAAVMRGAPVATYCGELLTMDDADARHADHYMFALDIKSDLLEQCTEKTQLCVDALAYGSAARYINHSCRPNLAPVRVFTDTRDLRLPVVALFAVRDIKAFEELTFDYGDKFWSVKRKTMKCECGAAECRYPTRDDDIATN